MKAQFNLFSVLKAVQLMGTVSSKWWATTTCAHTHNPILCKNGYQEKQNGFVISLKSRIKDNGVNVYLLRQIHV